MSENTVTPYPTDEAAELRRTARNLLHSHGHSMKYTAIPVDDLADEIADDEQLTRENCGACALDGFEDTTEDGVRQPNYTGWERIYVQAGRTIPAKYRQAFEDARMSIDDPRFAAGLTRDILTFGVAHEQ